jgi:outer membrane protein W
MLPITTIFTHYFGNKNNKLRPTASLMLAYDIFFEATASDSLANFSGGPTKVKVKNAPAYAPMIGLDYKMDDRWTLSAQLGYQFSRTYALVTTQTDPYVQVNSKVVYDLPYSAPGYPDQGVGAAAATALQTSKGTGSLLYMYRALAVLKTGDQHDLGTYTRRVDIKSDALVFFMSMSYAF